MVQKHEVYSVTVKEFTENQFMHVLASYVLCKQIQ